MSREAPCGFDQATLLWQYGPNIEVRVGFDPSFRRDALTPPEIPETAYHALIDTGAGRSCIDRGLATALGLPVSGERSFAGVFGGPRKTSVHLAQVSIPALQYFVYGELSAVDLSAAGFSASVLLGRDFLSNLDLVYSGSTGAATLILNRS